MYEPLRLESRSGRGRANGPEVAMYDFFQDLRFGLRMMVKSPVVAAVAVISLAAGICANTTTFAVASGFFAPFRYADEHEMVMLWQIHRSDPDDDTPVSPANYLDYRERATVFEDLVAYDVVRTNLTGGDAPERIALVPTNPETFLLLGREPLLGGHFEASEGVPGAGRVAIPHVRVLAELLRGRPEYRRRDRPYRQ